MTASGQELRPRTTRLRRNPVEAAREIADHAVRIARLELELRLVQLKRRANQAGIGAGLGLAALLLAPVFVGFLFAALAAGLATTISVWLAILIAGLALGLVVAGLAGAAYLFGNRAFKGAEAPVERDVSA
jgi:enhancing lycopene biosynthesis protein 2